MFVRITTLLYRVSYNFLLTVKDLEQSVFKLVAHNLTIDADSTSIIGSFDADLKECLFECNNCQDCMLIVISSYKQCTLVMFESSLYASSIETTRIFKKQKYYNYYK
jgi:hypothetical protein